MLDIIRRTVQQINAAPDFNQALQIMVQAICKAIAAKACTVFLLDKQQDHYVLMATAGLNPQAVGKICLAKGEGLIGLVGQREEPINLDDASSHPNFKYAPEAGEESYHAFLGVPIIHQRQVLGVLSVQQPEPRRFDQTEEAFLVTMSAHLAGIIAHAQATGDIARLLNPFSQHATVLMGLSGSTGIGIGKVVVAYSPADLDAVPERKSTDSVAEQALFEQAIAVARAELQQLAQRLPAALPDSERALFDAYIGILDDASLSIEICQEIQQGYSAQSALRRVIHAHVQQFEAMEDAYLRERASDFRDLGRRILSHLQARQQVTPHYSPQTILVGEEISAAMLAEVPEGYLVGIVAAQGASNSHIAIFARALGIPAVLGVTGLELDDLAGREVIVDGYQGQLYVSPTEQLRQEYLAMLAHQQALDANLASLRNKPTETLDGHAIDLLVNIGLTADAGMALSVGTKGVGLYRTEVPFMTQQGFPAEEEQRVIYRQLLQAFAPRPVTMRTLDVGGDKPLPYFSIQEANPFLGWRGMRVTLDHPEVFLMQLRAMLRASCGMANLQIMLPMISSLAEVDEALRLLRQAHGEITVEEDEAIPMPRVGVMIEVPSAVYQAEALAKRVDFLSIGSNDLTQYLLAVDRNNSQVAGLYDALHPAVLMALQQVIKAAKQVGKPVSICGEMAGDPASVVALLGMGFDTLSMNAIRLPRIKWLICNFSRQQAQQLLSEVLLMEHAASIRRYLEQALERAGLGELLRI